MNRRWFDGGAGGDVDALAFLDAVNAVVARDRLPVDPEETWVCWMGACLYLAVPVPALQAVPGFAQIAADLEVVYWPAGAPGGRGVEADWGDSRYPLDAQLNLRRGRLKLNDPGTPPQVYATITLSWLREQLARPLQMHGWTNSSAGRIVLADDGDVLARRGRQRWRGAPDVVEPLQPTPDRERLT